MNRILLIGWSGQVGRELMPRLEPIGDLTFADLTESDGDFQSVPLDLADLNRVESLVFDLRPDVIINAAAYTAVDTAEAEDQQSIAMRVNGEAPGHLANSAKRLRIPLFHYSTDYVFDGSGNAARTERDPTRPLNVYGASKLEGERRIAESGAAAFVLRTSWVVSAHGHNFVKTILNFARERKTMKVVADQHGAPTSAAVLADVTAELVKRYFEDPARLCAQASVYHLVCTGETTWFGVAEEVFRLARAAGEQLAVEELLAISSAEWPLPAKRPLNSRLDCSKFKMAFGIDLPTWQCALKPIIAELLLA